MVFEVMRQKIKKLVRQFFGSTRNFLIWIILLSIALLLLNNLSEVYNEKSQVVVQSNKDKSNAHKSLVENRSNRGPQKVGGSCDPNAPKCLPGYVSYLIRSGQGRSQMPIVCFNGEYIIDSEKKNAKRGLNLIVINDKTYEVEDVRTFDTYQSDELLKRYLKLGIPDTFIVLVASLDDGGYSLTPDSRNLLSSYGSKLIQDLNFRDNFVMLGQRKLSKGHSIEKLSVRVASTDFAPVAEIKGCTSLPVGPLEDADVTLNSSKHNLEDEKFQMGAGLINCGVPEPCDEVSFSVHMYTGLEAKDMCKLCINGKYIFAKGLNNAGRGLNVAVISPKTRDVMKLAHFDTFSSSSSTAGMFMEMLDEKDIVIAISHDEASTNLDVNLQRQFESLGSSMISRLSFRDVWVFVGQKGINGKSPIEELSQAKQDWPTPIDKRLCVPINLGGQASREAADQKSAKKEFCGKHKNLVDDKFCSAENLDKLVEPVPHVHHSWVTNDVYKIPIIIIPGSNYKSFQVQIENLFMNPGIKRNMINVIYDRKHNIYADMSVIFGVRSHSILFQKDNYPEFFRTAFEKAWKIYPYEKTLIFLEEEVVPTSDFLSFINQCLTSDFMADGSLSGISTWTHYRAGFGLTGQWYRSNFFPGLGFLMKRNFYVEYIQGKMDKCCTNRTWFGWTAENVGRSETIFPDAPRVYRLPYAKPATPSEEDKISSRLFASDKSPTQDFSVKLSATDMILSSKYESLVGKLIAKSTPFNQSSVVPCLKSGAGILPKKYSGTNNLIRSFSIFYKQKHPDDFEIAYKIAKCFQFQTIDGLPIPNMRKGLLRISEKEDEITLVGSLTEYFRHKPKNASVIEAS